MSGQVGSESPHIWIAGVEYEIDLPRIRHQLARRSVEGQLLSQESLAKRIGITRQTLSKVMNGKWENPKTETLAKLKVFLHLSFDEVLHAADVIAA